MTSCPWIPETMPVKNMQNHGVSKSPSLLLAVGPGMRGIRRLEPLGCTSWFMVYLVSYSGLAVCSEDPRVAQLFDILRGTTAENTQEPHDKDDDEEEPEEDMEAQAEKAFRELFPECDDDPVAAEPFEPGKLEHMLEECMPVVYPMRDGEIQPYNLDPVFIVHKNPSVPPCVCEQRDDDAEHAHTVANATVQIIDINSDSEMENSPKKKPACLKQQKLKLMALISELEAEITRRRHCK